jgi:hypothetical protein
MLERFGETTEAVIGERIAKACLLLPLGGTEQEAACRMADQTLSKAGTHWLLPYAEATKGLADYRRGRFAQAVSMTDRALSRAPRCWNSELPARLVRAMALHRLGRTAQAMADLHTASKRFCHWQASNICRLDRRGGWHDRFIAGVLVREAEALILDTRFPTDCFAPAN